MSIVSICHAYFKNRETLLWEVNCFLKETAGSEGRSSALSLSDSKGHESSILTGGIQLVHGSLSFR